MIQAIGQIMLYVSNQEEAANFWTENLGFVVKSREDNGKMQWIEIAPSNESETSFVLHNKELIAKMEPELNLGTPSLMLFTKDLDQLYRKLTEKNITVGEVVEMPAGRVFNFADYEDNYFAVMELS
ncbi:VOC family protein [Ornithinibacillus californiensis]|uniref:VOC family protein n=1 Tax=Ornithinibacillus californiensis TaxID=161536 RepID=UPI00064D955E|nr:VOC family protein [Ornithinibacillus californiensis]